MDLSKKTTEYVGSALVVYLVMLALYYFGVKHYFYGPADNMAKCGVFGDMFGGFNALFAGLGFIAVATTTFLQIEQFKEDRENSHRNQVENTFFNMLETLREIAGNTYYQSNATDEEPKEYRGAMYLKYAMKMLQATYQSELYRTKQDLAENDKELRAKYKFTNLIPVPEETRRSIIIKSYESFYVKHEHNLGHYFRYLYNIFKYILSSFENNPDIAERYIGLIQAQMSNDELGLTFYNGISAHSKNLQLDDVFRRWLDSYDIFENIDPRCVFDDAFLRFYPMTHFKYKLREQAA